MANITATGSASAEMVSLWAPGYFAVDSFLSGEGPGPQGLTLRELLSKDDEFFEACHDFIQWLFPLNSRSAFHPDAPVLSPAELAALSGRARIGSEAAFERILKFYGLVYVAGQVRIGPNWDERMSNWVPEPTHNSLRLTRILRSLAMQRNCEEAQALLSFLVGLFADYQVSAERKQEVLFWRQAVAEPEKNGLS